MHPTGNQRLPQKLAADGVITAEQQEAALNHHHLMGGRIEEALLDINAVDEATLLKYLAALHRTRFVSTDKLAKAEIDRATLEKVPKKMAEQETVFPVMYDPNAGTLSVVTPDPDNATMISAVQLASGARKVLAFVGRPLAVRAAINKSYGGDIHAFATLDKSAHAQFSTMLNVFERNLVSEESLVTSLADEGRRERVISPEELAKGGSASTVRGGIANEAYLETLNVLVSLLESTRADLRGHSAQVARLVRKLSERIGLSEVKVAAYCMAAYLHDIGKMSAYHLTALNVSEYEGHRKAGEKSHTAPLRLMESVELPVEAREAIGNMYERFDGKGLPGNAAGKEIPLGSRILAIADTYADLTQNPKNPFRKELKPPQACEVLARYKGSIFDPNLVDLFRQTVSGEDLRARLLANRHLALVIDPDPEETTVLELRLVEQGFEVEIARSAEQAIKILQRGETNVVVSELDLSPTDGFALLAQARKADWGAKVPWIIVTSRKGSKDAQKAIELGAADYVTKPVSAELLVVKLKTIMEREARSGVSRGVSGSLQEMGLPEIVQVLWHGRKTGSLKITAAKERGEIHFVEGAIFNALWGTMRGADAFYAMVRLTQGD
ncbi:MAG TPA: HD domain-containing phosphohydrolase, partial [Polyangiaceae bacterium]|nr:HD domain-containing phosphohydrolase [Polyangiaceae bacterium]